MMSLDSGLLIFLGHPVYTHQQRIARFLGPLCRPSWWAVMT